jgi:superfamily I DNA/RNA helicase
MAGNHPGRSSRNDTYPSRRRPHRLPRAEATTDRRRAIAFLEIFEPVPARYTEALRAEDEIDFNDMITEAVRHLESGWYRSPFRCILVDEFQDISVARADLLQALLRSRGVMCRYDTAHSSKGPRDHRHRAQ